MIPSRNASPSHALLAGLLLLGCGLARDVRAGNIVQDPGFESADPGASPGDSNLFDSGQSIDGGAWVVTQGMVGVDTQTSFIFAGNKSLFLDGDNGGPDSITQTLVTTPGQLYTISFWANADVPNDFLVTFGGVAVAGIPTTIAQNGFPGSDPLSNSAQFVLYTGTAMATSSSTDLTFTVTASPTVDSGVTIELDNINVSSVPEPSTLTLAALGAAGTLLLGAYRRGRSRFANR